MITVNDVEGSDYNVHLTDDPAAIREAWALSQIDEDFDL